MSAAVDFIEVEDYLPLDLQEKLIKHLTHPSFPWAMSLDAVYGAGGKEINEDSAIGFYHTALYKSEQCSDQLDMFQWMINGIESSTNGALKVDKLNRIRVGLFTKHPDPTAHRAHVDADFPHWVGVYYVTPCDGDLVLYNETFPQVPQELAPIFEFTEKHRFTPAQGKLVLFNGAHYHASSYPTKTPLRIAITFNFTTL